MPLQRNTSPTIALDFGAMYVQNCLCKKRPEPRRNQAFLALTLEWRIPSPRARHLSPYRVDDGGRAAVEPGRFNAKGVRQAPNHLQTRVENALLELLR